MVNIETSTTVNTGEQAHFMAWEIGDCGYILAEENSLP